LRRTGEGTEQKNSVGRQRCRVTTKKPAASVRAEGNESETYYRKQFLRPKKNEKPRK